MKIETFGLRNRYRVFADGKKIMDIYDESNAYRIMLKGGMLKPTLADVIDGGIQMLRQVNDPASAVVISVLTTNKAAVLESLYQTVKMQYPQEENS